MNKWTERFGIAAVSIGATVATMNLANKPILPETKDGSFSPVPARIEAIRIHARVNGQEIILKVDNLEYRIPTDTDE